MAAWSRDQLVAMLVGTGVVAVGILFGLGWLVVQTVATSSTSVAAPAVSSSPVTITGRDGIAAAPMPSVAASAAFQADPALTSAGTITVPAATVGRGPAGVPTGFPHTPEGAVGQLAAIDQTVLEAMDLDQARQVHDRWVMSGGPAFATWSLTVNVQSFLTAGDQGGRAKDITTVVTATPAAAIVKGQDGPDWVLGCVLFDVKAAIKTDARMGYGSCSRMEWSAGRWQIGAGAEPAPAPSTWPGSQAAVDAGWLTWKKG